MKFISFAFLFAGAEAASFRANEAMQSLQIQISIAECKIRDLENMLNKKEAESIKETVKRTNPEDLEILKQNYNTEE